MDSAIGYTGVTLHLKGCLLLKGHSWTKCLLNYGIIQISNFRVMIFNTASQGQGRMCD